MSILGQHALALHAPFCDALNLTFPRLRADDVRAVLRPELVSAGGCVEFAEVWRLPRLRQSDLGLISVGGRRALPTVRVEAFGQVLKVGFSGGSCETLRLRGQWVPLLSELAQFEYRVTGLHATCDVPIDGPSSIASVKAAGRAGGLRIGRKAVPSGDVAGHDELDARGALAGGVYLGDPRRVEIRGFVYCKRHETERAGLPDPGPLTRVELRFKDVGATLRDAADPSMMFWHYARALLTPPEGVQAWSAGDTGFMLPPRAERDLWAVLKARVDAWPDLLELGLLADQLGPYGRATLLQRIALALRVPPESMRRWAANLATV